MIWEAHVLESLGFQETPGCHSRLVTHRKVYCHAVSMWLCSLESMTPADVRSGAVTIVSPLWGDYPAFVRVPSSGFFSSIESAWKYSGASFFGSA